MGKCRYLKGDLSYIRVMRYDKVCFNDEIKTFYYEW